MSNERKLVYDSHNRCFYFESKMEALDRVCNDRAKKAEAMNRSEDIHLDSYKKLIDQEEHIISQKRIRQIGEMRESLRERVAYRRVLDKIRDKNERNIAYSDLYGQYGEGCSRTDLVPQLETELKLMTPQEKRQKEVRRLLRQRNPIQLLDRSLPDDVILGKRPKRRERHRTQSEERKRAKLVLPPITVSMATMGKRSRGSTGSNSAGKCSDQGDDVIETNSTLPTVFMTGSDDLQY